MQKTTSNVSYRVSPAVTNEELNSLFASVWEGHHRQDFVTKLAHSLAFICAYHEKQLIGFVNIAWDGGLHAFILDTSVDKKFRHQGIGLELIKRAVAEAKRRGAEWLHVDFEPHLQDFYDKCGFRHTAAGLIKLN